MIRLLCKNLLKQRINQRDSLKCCLDVEESIHSQVNQLVKTVSVTAFV